jgi:hypothetical protein
MTQLNLYSTSHCHLCEQAETLLKNLASRYAFNWKTIEIAEDENLLLRYAVLIPVLVEPNTGIEISWPYSAEHIVEKFNLKLR